MSKQGKWASILIMEPPSVPAWARATKTRSAIHSKIEWISERDRFFIKTFCLPFWSEPSGTKRGVGGKPVIRGYWIVIGCNAGQGSFNAGQGSNRILPNCPFCHSHPAHSSSADEQNANWFFHPQLNPCFETKYNSNTKHYHWEILESNVTQYWPVMGKIELQ